MQHKTGYNTAPFPSFIAMGDMEKNERDIATAMKPCSFEAGQEGFYRIKHPASPFRLTGDFEGAVGMRSEDECLTNISNRHFVQ